MLSTVYIQKWCQIAPRSGQVVVLANCTGKEDYLTRSAIIVTLGDIKKGSNLICSKICSVQSCYKPAAA